MLGAARRAGVPVVATAHDHSQVCATKVMLYHGRDVCSGPGLRKCIGCAYTQYGLKGIPLAVGLHELGSRRHRDVAQWTAISTALAARGSAPRPADRSPMEVIPTFIDDDLLALASDERSAARPDFVPATGPYLFYAGALGAYKGVDVLLDAHARLRAGGLDIPLVLAGLPRGDFRVGDRPGVVVATNVPHSAVVAALRHAAVGVVPSLVPEGFGLVALECLAAGTPCVVSALGGLLDVVQTTTPQHRPAEAGRAGWVVRWGYLPCLETSGIPTHFCAAILPPPIAVTYSPWFAKSVTPLAVTVTNTGMPTWNWIGCGVSIGR